MSLHGYSYTFYSNFLNHHQLPFCLEMRKLIGDRFRFVATESIHQDRLVMGYTDMNKEYPFVVRSYENVKGFEEAMRLGNESDVVIIGSAPECFVEKRISENKLTFRYSERIFKEGRWRVLDPRMIKHLYLNHSRYYNKKLYMLCASAYTASDFALVGAYRKKCFKWGYFPEVKEYELSKLMACKNESTLSILWVGRFLDWKHPEKALYVAKYLRDKGVDFSLTMIGGGEYEERLKGLTNTYELKHYVKFLGYRSPEVVREYMEESDIYLFTSDYNEGWGAVLNEAMNSACAVVCSDAIGSVPFLIEHKENGMIYKNNNINELCELVLTLVKSKNLRSYIGKNAYKTIMEEWNSKIASLRLLELAEGIISGINQKNMFLSGPCSFANIKL